MVSAANTFEGGTNGTGITTGNSGGASGNAFDLVSTGAGATATYDNTNVMHGLLAAKLAIVGAATNCHLDWNAGTLTGGPFNQIWFRAYGFLPVLPPGGNLGILRARTSGSALCGGLGILPSGQVITYDGGGTTRTTSVTKLVAGQYFRLEGYVIGSATAGQVQVSIFASNPDGTIPDEVNTTLGTLNTTGTIQQCICGNPSTLGNFTLWIDDFAVSTTGPLGPSVSTASNNSIPDEYWSWTPPLPNGSGFAAPISLQQPWLGIGTLGGSRFGVPQLRGQDYEIPFASGQTWRAKWANSRTITMVMWTAGIDQAAGTPGSGPNASQILAWNENFNTIRRAFYARGPNGSLQGKLTRRWLLNQGPVLINTLFDQQVGGGTANVAQITPQAGDVIVVKGIGQASTDVIGTPIGGGLTYTLQGSVVNVGQTWTGIWTATVPASGDGIPFTVAATAATGSDMTLVVEQWRNCTVLAANTLTGFGSASNPTLSPFVPANSYTTWAIGDTSVASGTPAYISGGTEVVRDYSSAHYFSYFGNNSADLSASQAVGMSAPASQTWAMVAIVLQPTPTLVVATALAEVAGTMDPTMTGRTRSDFSTDLLLADPYFYGSLQTQMLYPGVVNQMVNQADAPVADGKPQDGTNEWICVLHGPLTSPIIINNITLGITFELASTIGSGHLVTVDFLNATAVDDLGNNLIGSVTHGGSRQWLMLGGGSNSVELTSGSASDTGYAALTWAPGYI